MPAKKPAPLVSGAARELTDAGLQHAVLMRAMPVLRHDVASPLSVMRMGTMLLKRRLGQGDLPPDQAVERVEQIEEQLAEIARHIRRLRLWDLQINDRHTVQELAREAVELARPMLMARGTEMEPLADDAHGWEGNDKVPHSLLYLVLAAIYHLAERPGPAPARVTVEPLGARGVRVCADGTSTASPDLLAPPEAGGPARPPALDLAALQQLAQPLGVQVHVAGPQVDITLPA
jgi:signal transduction histidine kinase